MHNTTGKKRKPPHTKTSQVNSPLGLRQTPDATHTPRTPHTPLTTHTHSRNCSPLPQLLLPGKVAAHARLDELGGRVQVVGVDRLGHGRRVVVILVPRGAARGRARRVGADLLLPGHVTAHGGLEELGSLNKKTTTKTTKHGP